MFTGIIEELGVVRILKKTGPGARLTVEAKLVCLDAKIGESIAVNGACLTLADIKNGLLSFDISGETLNRTNLARLKAGEVLNLERSLRADSRLSGHFVSGHIDGIGRIISKEEQAEFAKFEIEAPKSLRAYLIEKGSVCVDGISLTINKVSDSSFTVMLIPHTLSVTTLGRKRQGDYVNIEIDILAKYVVKLADKSAKPATDQPADVTKGLLEEHGFI